MHFVHSFRKGKRGIASAAMAMSLAGTVVGVGAAAFSGTAAATTDATSASGPIVVGGVDAGFNFPGTATGFQAGIYRFNKAGGLGGRKIKFLGVQDDQDSPASETTDVQQLVQSDHVFAVTPFADDVASSQLTTFLGQNTTPVIGYGVEQAFCENKWAISIIGCQQSFQGWETTSSIRQIIQASKKPGSQLKVAMEGYDSAPAVTVSQTLGEVWTSLGQHPRDRRAEPGTVRPGHPGHRSQHRLRGHGIGRRDRPRRRPPRRGLHGHHLQRSDLRAVGGGHPAIGGGGAQGRLHHEPAADRIRRHPGRQAGAEGSEVDRRRP
jgi:hypothetical protein